MKGSSQKGQWLQELQEATAATGHPQGVSRRPGGQGQQSTTTTNHGPRDPMFTDTAGQVPGLKVTATDVRPGLPIKYVPGCKDFPGQSIIATIYVPNN